MNEETPSEAAAHEQRDEEEADRTRGLRGVEERQQQPQQSLEEQRWQQLASEEMPSLIEVSKA